MNTCDWCVEMKLSLQKHEFELNMNMRDAKGQTAIALSAYYRHSNVTALLIASGADPFVQVIPVINRSHKI